MIRCGWTGTIWNRYAEPVMPGTQEHREVLMLVLMLVMLLIGIHPGGQTPWGGGAGTTGGQTS